MVEQNRCVILDGHAIMYRAYHAFKDLSDPTGTPINAVYGFSRILLKSIDDFNPRYLAVAFDHRKGKSKRLEQYENYKAQRPQMPDDLIIQVDLIKEVVRAFAIPQFELENFEADDILGTIARKLGDDNSVLTTIITGDKDLLQLVVDGSTTVFIPGRGKFSKDVEYTSEKVVQKMGVLPEQIPDLKALMGDPSDNIPGVKGIGAVMATKLIQTFDTLEGVYEAVTLDPNKLSADQQAVLKPKIREKLEQDKKMAFLSKELTTIDLTAPIDFQLEDCRVQEYNRDEVAALFEKYGFNSLMGLLPRDSFELAVQKALF